MSCKSAIFDKDTGRYNCKITECECMYFRPDSKRCVEEYGEGLEKEIYQEYEKQVLEEQKGKCKMCFGELGYKPKDNNKNYVCKKCFNEYEKEMEAFIYDY